jgi:hypothetical protein
MNRFGGIYNNSNYRTVLYSRSLYHASTNENEPIHGINCHGGNNKWGEKSATAYDPTSELEEDVLYYESLQEKRKEV